MMPKFQQSPFLLLGLVAITSACVDFGPELERPEEPSYPSDIHAAWSPDGKWIDYRHEDYTTYDSSYPNGLYLIDPDGNNRRLLVEGDAFLPSWSPDSQQIVFTTSSLLYIINFGGSDLEYLTGGRFPRWSPDGQEIVFTRAGTHDTVGVWIIHLPDRQEHRLGFGAMPDWSPDGQHIVYSGPPGETPTGSQIWTMEISGGQNIQLTQNSFITNRSPRWSPDGTAIVWYVLVKTKGEVWIMNSDGSGQRKLTDGSHPSFSPDSRTVAFSNLHPSGDKIVLWRVNVDGTDLRQLTH